MDNVNGNDGLDSDVDRDDVPGDRVALKQKPAKKKKNKRSVFLPMIILSIAVIAGSVGGFFFWTMSDLPRIKLLEEYVPLESTMVYSMDNDLLAELYVERRTFLPYYKIPEHVKNAFIAVEDVRFYKHNGIDFVRIFGALLKDIRARAFVQGGSTLTQQLAKMLFLKPDRSISRKIKEAALSIQIENHYTKDEIIGLYLNQAYFGTRSYGIEAAAHTYFGKNTGELTIGEAALLAAIPKAPSTYSPVRNPEKALSRRNLVLKKMYINDLITKSQYDKALKERIPTTYFSRKYRAPYFIDYVRNELEDDYGEKLYTSGIKVYTTLDSKMQSAAEQALAFGMQNLAKRGRKQIQAALVAIDLKTGGIKAMVGGTDFRKTQYNRATMAMRQSGSSFKPIVYLTALNNGYTPDDTILDEPISYPGKDSGDVWVPKNYKKDYHGPVTLRYAIAESLNAATVYLANRVGIKNVVETAKELGIKSTVLPYLSSAIGASDVTLIEMTYAYAALANGKRFKHTFVDKVVNRDGMVVEEAGYSSKNVIDPDIVDEERELLRGVIENGTGRAALDLDRKVYGKTGTTNDYTDAWFIGFDDSVAVGVWVGRDNHQPIGDKETGAQAALPIWMEFMKNIHPK